MTDEKRLFRALSSNKKEELEVIFEYFYQKYKVLLVFVAAQYIKDKADIEDIVQDTFIDFFKNARSIHTSLKSYLTMSCKNKCLDFIKRNKNYDFIDFEDTTHLLDVDNVENDNFFANEELTQIINEMKQVLLIEEIKIVLLHLVYGMKFEEIALKLSKNTKTIKTKYYRALKKYKNTRSKSK